MIAKATPLPHSPHPAAVGDQLRGMGEDFSSAFLSYKSYSPTRRAGWGLIPGLSTVEVKLLRNAFDDAGETITLHC